MKYRTRLFLSVRRIAAAFLLLMALGLGTAWGQDSITCVFRCTGIGTSQTYYLAHTNEAELSSTNKNVFAETSFDPRTCRWHFVPGTATWSSSKFYPLRENYPPSVNGDKNRIQAQLAGSSTGGNAFRGATSSLTRALFWYYNNPPDGATDRYVAYNPSTSIWVLDPNIASDYKTYAYVVNSTEGSCDHRIASIEGPSSINILGDNYEYFLSTEFISNLPYVRYSFISADGVPVNNDIVFWYDNSCHASAPSNDAPWGTLTKSWSLIGASGYATVNSSGVVTVNKLPDHDLTVTLRCTFHSDSEPNQIVDKEITLVCDTYLLMERNGSRIVKREGISTGLLSSTSFNPEELWTVSPVVGVANRHAFEAKSNDPNYYLSLGGWVKIDETTSIATTPALTQRETLTSNEQCSGFSDGEVKIMDRYYIYWDGGESQWKLEKDPVTPNAHRVIPIGVSYSEGNYQALSALLSGNSVVSEPRDYPITLSTETIEKTYELYQYNSTTHYWYDRADHDDVAPVNWGSIASITWSFDDNGADATFNDVTSQLTVNSMPATDTEVLITCTITDNASHTVTLTHNVLLTAATSTPLNHVLTIDDRENHSWSYYAGTDIEGYNDRYLGTLYSPQPRDVKITYMGKGGAVSMSEDEENFVYYETLE